MDTRLTRYESFGVTLLGDTRRPHGVTLCFSERTGGVSGGAYTSLNLDVNCGDEPACVEENTRRLLVAAAFPHGPERLVRPFQVHGTNTLRIKDGSDAALEAIRAQAAEGADAIVCTVPEVAVLLCYADCVPIILVADGGFAVVHSGWRGTYEHICAVALQALCEECGSRPEYVRAYIGPHIGAQDYEVSQGLIDRFTERFGAQVQPTHRHLDLAACIVDTLLAQGVAMDRIHVCTDSTASCTDRFFSYRGEGGTCGRIGALAWMEA